MAKYMLLPLVIFAMSSMLTWALARHLELAHAQRAAAASRPRARPYDTSLPEL
jgi:hypothetical protein